MSHSYNQSSYLAAPYSFEAVENPETKQLRPLSGISTFSKLKGGAMIAEETKAWTMFAAVIVKSFWVNYPGSPDGTITVTLFNPLGQEQQSLVFNTNNNGEKLNNAWAYSVDALLAIPKDWKMQFEPSVAIDSVIVYLEPCLFFDNQLE
jgi:hypothetical protein